MPIIAGIIIYMIVINTDIIMLAINHARNDFIVPSPYSLFTRDMPKAAYTRKTVDTNIIKAAVGPNVGTMRVKLTSNTIKPNPLDRMYQMSA